MAGNGQQEGDWSQAGDREEAGDQKDGGDPDGVNGPAPAAGTDGPEEGAAN